MKQLILVAITCLFINSTNASNCSIIETEKNYFLLNKISADIVQPDTSFLNWLEKEARRLTVKSPKNLTKAEKGFLKLLKTATNASTWNAIQFSLFAKKALPLSISAGIVADPDDGGEIYSKTQASQKSIRKFVTKINDKTTALITN